MRYSRASSLDEAIAAAAAGASLLAGGTDLVTMRQSGAVLSDHVVDIKWLADLQVLGVADEGAEIGAAVTLDRLARAHLPPGFAAISDGARLVGAPQTRARATVGGNVCRASPAGDMLPGLLALGASALLTGPEGQRVVSLEEFFVAPGKTAIRNAEVLTRLLIPAPPSSSVYERFTYRASLDLAVAGVAVALTLRDGLCVGARVALGGVGPTPVLVPPVAQLLLGGPPDASRLAAVGQLAASLCQPISDVRGSDEYRRHLVAVLLARVAKRAFSRGGVPIE